MSASQDKKKRQAERADGADKRSLAEREAARKAKKERTRWGIVGAIIVVFAVVVILLNTNLFYSGTTALTINGYELLCLCDASVFHPVYLVKLLHETGGPTDGIGITAWRSRHQV